jgi:hypothetical protein
VPLRFYYCRRRPEQEQIIDYYYVLIISGKILLARKGVSRSRERRHGRARERGVGKDAVGEFGRATARWATGLEEVGDEDALCCWWCMGWVRGDWELGSRGWWDPMAGPIGGRRNGRWVLVQSCCGLFVDAFKSPALK